MTTNLTKWTDSVTGADVELSIQEIKQTLCPTATDQEAKMFLEICRYQGLNPFTRDAYLIKYNNSPATIVVGKESFTKRAEQHPQFAGMIAGVIVKQEDGEITERKGSLSLDGETIVGGWATVHRNDLKIPVDITVKLEEFDTQRGPWVKMKGTMIRKVALVSALREAFPSTFAGMYDGAEMGVEMNGEMEIVTSTATPVSNRSKNALTGSTQSKAKPQIASGTVTVEPAKIPHANYLVANEHGIDPTLLEDMGIPQNALVADEPEEQALDPEVEEIINSTNALIAENAANADTFVDVEDGPKICTIEKHGNAPFRRSRNEATGEERWTHEVWQTVNNQRTKSFCIYEGE